MAAESKRFKLLILTLLYLAPIFAQDVTWDENGYVIYCPCMGKRTSPVPVTAFNCYIYLYLRFFLYRRSVWKSSGSFSRLVGFCQNAEPDFGGSTVDRLPASLPSVHQRKSRQSRRHQGPVSVRVLRFPFTEHTPLSQPHVSPG